MKIIIYSIYYTYLYAIAYSYKFSFIIYIKIHLLRQNERYQRRMFRTCY